MKKIFCLTILAVLCTFGVASAQQFPSVQIETQDGKTIDTKTLIDGKTPVIISFWSTTCKPCIKELDAISEQMIDWLDEADFRLWLFLSMIPGLFPEPRLWRPAVVGLPI